MWRLIASRTTAMAPRLASSLSSTSSSSLLTSSSTAFAAAAAASKTFSTTGVGSKKASPGGFIDRDSLSKSERRLFDAMQLCWYGGAGDVAALRKLFNSGLDINAADYDMRTGVHLAASEGHLEAVKFFVENGASINVVDRFGSTPVLDAIKGRHLETTQYLLSKGAVLNQEKAASDLCAAAANNDVSTVVAMIESGVNVDAADYDARSALHLAASEGHTEMVELLLSHGANYKAQDRFGNTPLADAARHSHADILSILTDAETNGVEIKQRGPLEVPTAVYDAGHQDHMKAVAEQLYSQGVFRAPLIKEEVDWYYNHLQLHRFYFRRFAPEEVAGHVSAYVAAKRLASQSGKSDELRLNLESEHGAFYITSADQDAREELKTRMHTFIRQQRENRTNMVYSMSSFTSGGTAVPYGSKRLAMYVLDIEEHAPCAMEETDLKKIASNHFLKEIPEGLHSRYQDIVDAAVGRMSPVVQIHERRNHDNSIPVLIATRPNSHNANFADMSKLIFANNLTCERKLIEGFANGVTVYTLYIAGEASDSAVRDFTDQISLQLTMPVSNHVSPLFLAGEITAREYAYISAVSKYIAHFSPAEVPEYKSLLADEQDASKRLRLLALGKSLRAQQFSEPAIVKSVVKHFDLFQDLFKAFDGKFNPAKATALTSDAVTALQTRIDADTSAGQENAIMSEFLEFNDMVLKTNFYKTRRAAVSFRLNPAFLDDYAHMFPDIPYGIIMCVANDFYGFHVRFRDVARGGLRIIKSRDETAYAKNAESVFVENYNLAHTQNLKNKDIPEFGSKGTILLGLDHQAEPELKFRKYISSILDLLIEDKDVVDYYGQPEILFMGPDEYTADLMEWAALYAKGRGYAYWKAFTTGKPPSIGGIPHDTYGMTTRSVHKYVTELLADAGIDESSITKVQTGGPDGDLGSNEILISRDITKAIVDGSGVLFDPEGLDRVELTRLAHERAMGEAFDTSKLSSGGFFVGVNDTNVSLPSGEVVKAGDTFRNNFHLHPLFAADLFVPCGGRPESISAANIHHIIDPETGVAKFKYIVEGANLFVTHAARLLLEEAGVQVFRDASTNKGGVTSSSLEVLAALTLNDDEFATHMQVLDSNSPPEFYETYAQQIQTKVEENARLEYRALQREFAAGRGTRTELSDVLSSKINILVESIDASDLFDDAPIRHAMMSRSIPDVLIDLVGGVDEVVARLPEAYAKAIFSASLASHYVYTQGLASNEIDFYRFVQKMHSNNL